MAINVSSVRSAIASKISSLSGFSESRVPFAAFGRTANSVAHLRFCVQVPTTQAGADRQRRSTDIAANTELIVRFAYRLRPRSAYPTDYDSALDTEETVIFAVLSGDFQASAPEITPRFLSSSRNLTDSGEYLIIDVSFNIYHYIGA